MTDSMDNIVSENFRNNSKFELLGGDGFWSEVEEVKILLQTSNAVLESEVNLLVQERKAYSPSWEDKTCH